MTVYVVINTEWNDVVAVFKSKVDARTWVQLKLLDLKFGNPYMIQAWPVI